MYFLYVKHEQVCRHCKGTIVPGEEAVILRIKTAYGTFPWLFHTTCYEEWAHNSFLRRWQNWKSSAKKRPPRKYRFKPKMGRPRKYLNPYKARNLQSLLNYHRRMGNKDRVVELEVALKDLELR